MRETVIIQITLHYARNRSHSNHIAIGEKPLSFKSHRTMRETVIIHITLPYTGSRHHSHYIALPDELMLMWVADQ